MSYKVDIFCDCPCHDIVEADTMIDALWDADVVAIKKNEIIDDGAEDSYLIGSNEFWAVVNREQLLALAYELIELAN